MSVSVRTHRHWSPSSAHHRRTGLAPVLAAAVILGLTGLAHAQQPGHSGKDFWLAFPQNASSGTDLSAFEIVSDAVGTVRLDCPGPSPLIVTVLVGPGNPKSVSCQNVEITTNKTVESKGIHLSSTAPITVVFRSPITPGSNDDAYLGLPTAALGQEYVVMGFEANSGFPSELVILGTQNGTNVTLNPSCESAGSLPGNDLPITLNQGETYQYQCGPAGDVSGSIVTSDKPVAVFGGSRCSEVPTGTPTCDYLVEQMFPSDTWGTEFIVPILGNGAADIIRVLAKEDDTQVTLVESVARDIPDASFFVTAETVTLNRGEFTQFTASPNGASAVAIVTSKPVLVAQYAQGSSVASTGDPLELLIVPTSLFLHSHRVISPTDGYSHFLNIVAPDGASILLDGNPLSPSLSPVPTDAALLGSSGVFKIFEPTPFRARAVAVGTGEHVITSDQRIAVFVSGFRSGGSYGYPAGMAASVFSEDLSESTTQDTSVLLLMEAFSRGDSFADLNLDFEIVSDPSNGVLATPTSTPTGWIKLCSFTGSRKTCRQFVEYQPNAGFIGTNSFVYRANDGAVVSAPATFTVDVTGPVPDFILSPSPGTRTVVQGQTTTYTLSLESLNGFDEPVTLSVASGLPAGIEQAVFSPNPVTPTVGGASSTLTITTSIATPTGTHVLGIQGLGASQTHLTIASLEVSAAPVLISPTLATIPVNGTLTFGGVGGTPPYSFSIIASTSPGAGINGATGLYTAGSSAGTSTVRVTDSALTPNSAEATVSVVAAAGQVTLSLDGRSLGAGTAFTLFPDPSGLALFTGLSTTRVHDLRLTPGDYTLSVPAGTGTNTVPISVTDTGDTCGSVTVR